MSEKETNIELSAIDRLLEKYSEQQENLYRNTGLIDDLMYSPLLSQKILILSTIKEIIQEQKVQSVSNDNPKGTTEMEKED